MAFIMRSLVCNKIIQSVSGFPIGGRGLKPSSILPFLKVAPQNTSTIEYQFDINAVEKCEAKHQLESEISPFSGPSIVEKIQLDDTVTAAYLDEKTSSKVKLKVCSKKVVEEVINLLCERPMSFWKSSALFSMSPKQKVIVEYSSPNIAKPFHMGHLRSTIVGNFISNLHQAMGHEVIRLNYLGDWGTQFGILKYGYDAKNMSQDDLKSDPIKTLYKLYVWSNAEAEKSPEILEKAKNIFNSMEKGEEKYLNTWKLFRDFSIQDFKKVYQRLNVTFDEYHGESMYRAEESSNIVHQMGQKGILKDLPDGRKVYNYREESPNVTIIKSDGSTMYLTRDIAAAIHRFKKFSFDKMYYVVDTSQHEHFVNLIHILKELQVNWWNKLHHVKFGRILGMSTRKGTAIFLEDVLDEAKELMEDKQKESKNTVFEEESESSETADIVGASAILIADLRRKRMKDYVFKWEDALQSNGDTGLRLQYAHCRLVRLEENCGVSYAENADLQSLVEPEVIRVVRNLARFDEVLLQSYDSLEPCTLVNYLFDLSTSINKAFLALPVKTAPLPTAQDRLKLFRASRHALAAGMRILGLNPLDRM